MSITPNSHLHFVQSVEILEGGGLGTSACQLSDAMRALGLSSKVVSTARERKETERLRTELTFGPRALFLSPKLIASATSLVQPFQFIHGHGFYVGTNFVFGSAAKRLGKHLIYHPHGMFEPWILRRSSWKKRVVHLLFENRNFREAKLWRALTNKEADQIRGVGITAPIAVIPNGIDLSVFHTLDEAGCAQFREKIILFLGRVHPKKGLVLLLKSWSRLSARFPDWKVVIAGPDEAEHQESLEVLCSSEGIPRVSFTGRIEGEEKVKALKMAGLFVLPSYSEGLPMSVLEAMGAKTPVLITDACNLPEVGRSEAGWICGANEESFLQKLEEALLADDAELRERGAAGRRLVEERFQWAQVARDLDIAAASTLI